MQLYIRPHEYSATPYPVLVDLSMAVMRLGFAGIEHFPGNFVAVTGILQGKNQNIARSLDVQSRRRSGTGCVTRIVPRHAWHAIQGLQGVSNAAQ